MAPPKGLGLPIEGYQAQWITTHDKNMPLIDIKYCHSIYHGYFIAFLV